MNLEDVIDPEYGLQQDKWTEGTPMFGKEFQVTVVGWSGKHVLNKYYILRCARCSLDKVLFGEGYFKSLKSSLIRGNLPCGCGRNTKWTKGQYEILCTRKAESLGYKFLGFRGEWKGVLSKIKMLCEKHGLWDTGIIKHLVSKGTGCPQCRIESVSDFSRKDDDIMITSFLSSGGFHPGTKFWRSERLSSIGTKIYWHILCPVCEEQGESQGSALRQGKCSCACSMQRQQEGYINLVKDNNKVVAIKFGISRDSSQRIKQQNSKSKYELEQHMVYYFPDVNSCKRAERECKKELECGVLTKQELLDGYTETTHINNLEKIIEIYERNGGILNECNN